MWATAVSLQAGQTTPTHGQSSGQPQALLPHHMAMAPHTAAMPPNPTSLYSHGIGLAMPAGMAGQWGFPQSQQPGGRRPASRTGQKVAKPKLLPDVVCWGQVDIGTTILPALAMIDPAGWHPGITKSGRRSVNDVWDAALVAFGIHAGSPYGGRHSAEAIIDQLMVTHDALGRRLAGLNIEEVRAKAKSIAQDMEDQVRLQTGNLLQAMPGGMQYAQHAAMHGPPLAGLPQTLAMPAQPAMGMSPHPLAAHLQLLAMPAQPPTTMLAMPGQPMAMPSFGQPMLGQPMAMPAVGQPMLGQPMAMPTVGHPMTTMHPGTLQTLPETPVKRKAENDGQSPAAKIQLHVSPEGKPFLARQNAVRFLARRSSDGDANWQLLNDDKGGAVLFSPATGHAVDAASILVEQGTADAEVSYKPPAMLPSQASC
jgi:hypothetical protein